MFTGMIAFVVGTGLLQLLPELPTVLWLLFTPPLLWLLVARPRLRWLGACALGFLWALSQAHLLLSSGLDPQLEGRDLLVEGIVSSITETRGEGVRFIFDVDRLLADGHPQPSPGRIRLGWYRGHRDPHPGERWRLLVRLKRPHGFANPGGFDYEAWLFRQRIRATGYVRDSAGNQRLDSATHGHWVERMRQSVRSRISSALAADEATRGLFLALAIGDRSGLPPQQWQTFSDTGTNHLIAISGLHIGIVSGLVLFLFRRLWALSERLTLCCPAPQAAAVAALLSALGYAAMAGFAVPTQRALIMLSVVLGALLLRRGMRPLQSLTLALFLVVLADPFALTSQGLWLSFGAVAIILYALVGRRPRTTRVAEGARVQWAIGIGLLPLLLFSTGRMPLAAPLINLLAVPWFSLVIIPLVLAGTVLNQIMGTDPSLWGLTTGLLSSTLSLLDQAASWTGMLQVPAQLPAPVWPLALLGTALLLAPRGLPARWLGSTLLLPLLLLRAPLPAPGEVRLTLLDVGQGLSAVIRTRHHTLVYDTGARFSPRFDIGSAVLAPYLRGQGVSRIDRLILSNGDNDHAGGAAALLQRIPAASIISGEPGRLQLANHRVRTCRKGQQWSWDGVGFEILHPPPDPPWRGNEASCVLLVDNGNARILLTGDIEKRAEKALLASGLNPLHADILIIPHHGSKTSSTPAFVAAVAPRLALVSTGYRNRYRFPRPEVVARWQASGARVIDTAAAGAIRLRVPASGSLPAPVLNRAEAAHYWDRQPLQSTAFP